MEPPRTRQTDDMPRSASVDPPLSLEARTPGPRGEAPKIWLAALGLLILFAMVAAAWGASQISRKGALDQSDSHIEQHR
jgi:hypothetical protein